MILLMLIELIILIIVSLSIRAYLVFFCTTLISLKSSEQRTVARFSTEIEYKVLADNTVEVLWLHYLCQIYVSSSFVTTIWYDNLGGIYLSANLNFHTRTKYVNVDYYFVWDRVAKKEIQIHFISSKNQLVDVFTKSLPYLFFAHLRSKLHMDTLPSAWRVVL